MWYQPWRFFSLILILFLTTIASIAQSVQSSILGTVKDQGGAVILGAQVVATNQDTGIAASYTTDASGDFQAVDLSSGPYEFQVAKPGFQHRLISDLVLSA